MTQKILMDGLSEFARTIINMDKAISSGEWISGPAAEFHRKFRLTTIEHFQRLKHGGSWRGVTWKYFSPNSIGRKRPSGKIIEKGDSILQDTGRLIREAGEGFIRIGQSEVAFETNLSYAALHNEGGIWKKKAKSQFGKRDVVENIKIPARPFQFFTEDDISDLRQFTQEWLDQK